MNDYKELLGDIGVCLLAHPSETVSKIMLERAADAIEQLVKERDELLQERAKRELCINNHVPTAREVARAYDELYY